MTLRNYPEAYHDMEENGRNDAHLRTTTFTNIPEAKGLTWTDSFYDGKNGVVAVFDLDSEAVGDWFFWKHVQTGLGFFALGIFYGILAFFEPDAVSYKYFFVWALAAGMAIDAAYHAYAAVQQRRKIKTQHVSVTTEGIRLDWDGGVTIEVLFEDILEVEVHTERSGFREAGFQSVAIHRPADPVVPSFCAPKSIKMVIHGLVQVQEFVALVEAMKVDIR